MARRPVAFIDGSSISDALRAAETAEDHHALYEFIGRRMLEELNLLEQSPETHRPPMIEIKLRKKQ